MVKLSSQQLKEVLRWASRQKDKKGRSLLERARESLTSGSWLKYNTELEVQDGCLYWDCDCPDARRRARSRACCKHVIAKLMLLHERELSESQQWAEWFRKYHDRKLEEVLDAFAQF